MCSPSFNIQWYAHTSVLELHASMQYCDHLYYICVDLVFTTVLKEIYTLNKQLKISSDSKKREGMKL